MKGIFSILQTLLIPCLFVSPLTAQTSDVPSPEMSWQEMAEKIEEYAAKGKYQEALPFARACLEKARRDSSEESLDYGTSLDFLGYTLHHCGYYSEAEKSFVAAVAHARTHLGETHEDYITRLSNLAMLHMDMGELAKAVTELEASVRLAKKNLEDDNPYIAILINNLGLAYERIGNLDLSLTYYLKALEETERSLGKDNVRYAIRLSNIATIYRKIGLFEKSLDFTLEALPIFEKSVGKNHHYYATGLNSLINSYVLLSRFEEAFPFSDSLLNLMGKLSKIIYPGMYDYAGSISNLYYEAGQYQRCIHYSKQVLSTYGEIFPQEYSRHNFVIRRILSSLEKLGQNREAADYCCKHIRYSMEELKKKAGKFSEEEQLQYFQTYRERPDHNILSFAVKHPEFPELTAAVYDYEMTIKGLALTNRRRLFQSLREHPDAQLAAQFEEWQHLQNIISQQYALTPGKRQINLDSLLIVSNGLERNLVLQSKPFQLASRYAQWQELKSSLSAGEAALEFGQIKSPNTDSLLYVAWIVRPEFDAPKQVFLFEEKEIGNLAATRRLYSPETTPGAKNLLELIWTPMKPLLEGVHTLYFGPAGVLCQINVSAIPISATEILSDRIQVHRLVSTRQVMELKKSKQWTAPAAALVFGGIRYETDSVALASTNQIAVVNDLPGVDTEERGGGYGEGWSFLTGSLKEATAVRDYLQSVKADVVFADGFKASEGFFKKNVQHSPSPDVLHLATHGFFLTTTDSSLQSGFATAKNPMVRAGLILSGANRAWSSGEALGGQEDGILTALEISRLDLSHTELAVLSACGTGQGKIEAGEGVFGLQRAFKMAGAHYVIMTLWNVQDHDSQQFMNLFYRAWLMEKMPVPEAFRVAQKEMRLLHSKPFQPTAWAGFLLLE